MRLPTPIRTRLLRWATRHMDTHVDKHGVVGPDFVIWRGSSDNVYLQRWHVIPRNRFFNIYLHRFLGDDEDRALHDHPWVNVSLLLDGGYWEHREGKPTANRKLGSITFRRAKAAHRVQLYKDRRPIPAISLFLTGPLLRTWGFHCPKGFVPWFRFVDQVNDRGKSGPGCDG